MHTAATLRDRRFLADNDVAMDSARPVLSPRGSACFRTVDHTGDKHIALGLPKREETFDFDHPNKSAHPLASKDSASSNWQRRGAPRESKLMQTDIEDGLIEGTMLYSVGPKSQKMC
jgi:hypothetical protein